MVIVDAPKPAASSSTGIVLKPGPGTKQSSDGHRPGRHRKSKDKDRGREQKLVTKTATEPTTEIETATATVKETAKRAHPY